MDADHHLGGRNPGDRRRRILAGGRAPDQRRAIRHELKRQMRYEFALGHNTTPNAKSVLSARFRVQGLKADRIILRRPLLQWHAAIM